MAESPAAAVATVLLAGAADVVFGEPADRFHPVAGIGRVVGLLERRRPRDDAAVELAWGGVIVALTAGLAGLSAWRVAAGARRLPLPGRLALSAWALTSTFALRGLVDAARDVERALAREPDEGPDAARDALRALVSRDRDLDPPQIVSATVESLAENLTDSVVSPLLYYALFGLPGAAVYRAINTMDAMIGYRGEYEHVGKIAARLDDVANFVPARLAGLLVCAAAAARGRGRTALDELLRSRRLSDSPNKMWTIAPMAGALDVQLEKPGHYRVGRGARPLTPATIDEAIGLTWTAGALALVAAAGLSAVVRRRRSR